MNIVFIRHSKSLINPDIPITTWGLSEEGVSLAKKLNNLKKIKELDVIYASLQPKALETAILATKNSGIPIKIDNRLTETTSFTNKFVNLEQLEKNTKEYFSNENSRINNGETGKEALARFNKAINDIFITEKDKKDIGIVSHGNILASFAVQYTKGDAFELVENMKQPDLAVFNWETKKFTIFFGDLI
ncbi:histidine phosphatase family protein [Candidatus Microgenomates bacterium]|nr:histidine phosphatase family protein [Candidatus Microgenomates bacterium]